MIAVDTNVVVRLLIDGDDPGQARKARQLFDENDVFVPLTVLLETEWVLRANFKIRHDRVMEAFRSFAGLRRVTIQAEPAVLRAIEWSSDGLDFADALHLATTDGAQTLVTFDRAFARRAKQRGSVTVRLM